MPSFFYHTAQTLLNQYTDRFPLLKITQLLDWQANAGSAKERTMLHAIQTGKIQSGEAKLSSFRKELEKDLGMDVDISIIKQGGKFDNPPYIKVQ